MYISISIYHLIHPICPNTSVQATMPLLNRRDMPVQVAKHSSRQSQEQPDTSIYLQIHVFQLVQTVSRTARTIQTVSGTARYLQYTEYHYSLAILSPTTATYLTASAVYITQHVSNILRISIFDTSYQWYKHPDTCIWPSSSVYTLLEIAKTS